MHVSICLPYDEQLNFNGKVKVVGFNDYYPVDCISFQGAGMGGTCHPLPEEFRWEDTSNENRWAYYAPFGEMPDWLASVEAWVLQEILPDLQALCAAAGKISLKGFQPEIGFPQELAIENGLIRQLPRKQEGDNRFRNLWFPSEERHYTSPGCVALVVGYWSNRSWVVLT